MSRKISFSNSVLTFLIMACFIGFFYNYYKTEQEKGQYKVLKTIERLELLNLRIEKYLISPLKSQDDDLVVNLIKDFRVNLEKLGEMQKKYEFDVKYLKNTDLIKKDFLILNEKIEDFKSVSAVLFNSYRSLYDLKFYYLSLNDVDSKRVDLVSKALDYISLANVDFEKYINLLEKFENQIKKDKKDRLEDRLFVSHVNIYLTKLKKIELLKKEITQLDFANKLDEMHIKSFNYFKHKGTSKNLV